MKNNKTKYYIYYKSREYAREMGDPLLAVIEASTSEEAERKARKKGVGGMFEVMALQTDLLPGERIK